MLNDKTKNQVKKLHSQWQEQANKSKAVNKKFITVSGEEINPLYTPLDLEGIDFERDINFPGAYPYTRGVHANMYRGKMWTMRQFSGMGNAQQTNERYHFLLNKGDTKEIYFNHFL